MDIRLSFTFAATLSNVKNNYTNQSSINTSKTKKPRNHNFRGFLN